jgi:hypothetical protein
LHRKIRAIPCAAWAVSAFFFLDKDVMDSLSSGYGFTGGGMELGVIWMEVNEFMG